MTVFHLRDRPSGWDSRSFPPRVALSLMVLSLLQSNCATLSNYEIRTNLLESPRHLERGRRLLLISINRRSAATRQGANLLSFLSPSVRHSLLIIDESQAYSQFGTQSQFDLEASHTNLPLPPSLLALTLSSFLLATLLPGSLGVYTSFGCC